MSFDLDWDSESEADEEEDDADYDPCTISTDEHESIMDVMLDTAPRSDAPSRPVLAPSPPPPPETATSPITPVTIFISADLPPLPRLSSIPVGFLREYPDVMSLVRARVVVLQADDVRR
ncbi:hypothetical protein PHLGIDRAFT_173626 [Phlebiopsis gigantea 11061_1 CR5-6]|uniref:Uncharacterized protein n=1 Tax=Phlebiopsis gigantea (strain 11061_1 CR5-6) TaxID=745531 RepID=A0A0C3SEW4_PHLG1|nr:hypothetical protein PHLGIDRAFT_173626 [Phlebiopsis gigantea 11061_1 CR5-6]